MGSHRRTAGTTAARAVAADTAGDSRAAIFTSTPSAATVERHRAGTRKVAECLGYCLVAILVIVTLGFGLVGGDVHMLVSALGG
jgi:hypothetical protein